MSWKWIHGWGGRQEPYSDSESIPETPEDLTRPATAASVGATEPVGGWDETIGSESDSVLYNVTTDDAVVENLRVHGQIRVNANRVIVRNCNVTDEADEFAAQPLIWRFSGTGGQATDNTIVGGPGSDPAAAGIAGFEYIARNHISDCGDGIKFGGGQLIEQNWIEKMKWGTHNGEPTHCDGMQSQGGTGTEIRHNVVIGPLVDSGSSTSVGEMNSALNGGIFAKTDSGSIEVNIHDNEVRGFATNMYLYQTSPRTVSAEVTDNIIGSGDEVLFNSFTTVGNVSLTESGNVDQDGDPVVAQ